MATITFPNKSSRDEAFDEYWAKGIRADAYVIKGGDVHYEECSTGRYLVRKDVYLLEVRKGK